MPKYKGVQKKRSKWYWYIDYQGKRYWSKGFDTAEDSARDRSITKNKMISGAYVDSHKMTVRDFAIKYLEDFASGLSSGTFEIRESNLRLYILPFIGNVKIQDLKPFHILTLQKKLLEKTTVNNTRKIMTTLRTVLNKAIKWDVITVNPALKVDLPEYEETDMTILNPDQILKLIASSEIRERCILSLAAFAGLRSGELFGLMWDDINFEKDTITLNRQWTHKRIKEKLKSKKSKAEFPMVKDLAHALKEWKLMSKCKSWVFPARGEVHPLDVDNWSKYTFKILLEAHNLPEVKLHSLRHFFASAIIHSGVKAEDVKELMRHSSYQITMDFYRHLFPGQLEEALDKFHNYIAAVKKNV
ncbi:hypothetical protein LCGC14_1508950 [marine sediment metagenome]|uniref:Tyr recombinase domain-containing protein n=1 Tax=marine sediment metagenome TaxID=412755 RepID=A0A0F9J214_9ZZZZ